MARTVEFLDGARLDFDDSFAWYAERSVGAAIGFASAVDEAIDKVTAEPSRFPSTHGGCRYCSLNRYPFRIVFRDEPDRLVVVALAHAKRSPGYWRGRRDDEG
jgi:plasmid stabilization system protein ParE